MFGNKSTEGPPSSSSPFLLRREHSGPKHHEQNTPDSNEDQSHNIVPEPASSASVPSRTDTEQQFDLIIKNVNETIKHIGSTYKEIGYSRQEISEKQADIFVAINDTISSFTNSLQREKNNIGNECEWLRQQIRIILAMLSDSTGERTLSLSKRGIVFNDRQMLDEGSREDIYQQIASYKSHNSTAFQTESFSSSNGASISSLTLEKTFPGFHPYSPSSQDSMSFNTSSDDSRYRLQHAIENLSGDNILLQQQFEYMTQRKPEYSLLQQKSRLNSIFLEVLKAFIKIFKRFNEANRLLWENIEVMSEEGAPDSDSSLLKQIPSREEAESHALLIEEFEQVLRSLNLNKKNYRPESCFGMKNATVDEFAFIISSPRKRRHSSEQQESNQDVPENESMDKLREVNYKIVHAIRSLKVTKITNDVVSSLKSEIDRTEVEICNRVGRMKEVINTCLGLITDLSLAESDFITIQKMQDRSDGIDKTNISNEGYLDVDTLRFIETNPREFGLMDHHIRFITQITETLQSLRDSKQKKWDHYSRACIELWEKLGENEEFTRRFLEENSTLTDMSLANLKMELKRLYMKRSEYIDSFIVDAQRQISDLHRKLLYSDSRAREFKFIDFDAQNDCEDKEQILNEHEVEIGKLKAEYNLKEPVLKLYAQLNDLLNDQKFLVESSKDSSRLLSKNSCKILLNEEKIRKKINKNLPRVLESLKKEIIIFNNQALSRGERPICAGDQDLFEKILVHESELSNQGIKQSRVRIASPNKARPAYTSRSKSPIKMASPSKVTKERKHIATTCTKVPDLYHSSSAPVSRAAGLQRFRATFNNRSPENTRPTLPPVKTFETVDLKPLKSPLNVRTKMIMDNASPDRTSVNSSLYSICSRVSPMKPSQEENRSSHIEALSSKPPSVVTQNQYEETDKENHSHDTMGRYSMSPIKIFSKPEKRRELEYTNLDNDSLANSTINDDDYQMWRDNRIQQLNRNG